MTYLHEIFMYTPNERGTIERLLNVTEYLKEQEICLFWDEYGRPKIFASIYPVDDRVMEVVRYIGMTIPKMKQQAREYNKELKENAAA